MKRIAIAALLLAPALAACGEADQPAYEADAVDESGGQLIVNDADQPGVAVDVPDTAMTNVPAAGETPPADDAAAGTGAQPE